MLCRRESSIKEATLILITTAILSKVMGLVRELVIANQFGTGQELDNFLLAFTIPTVIISVFMYAIPGAIIPTLSQIRIKRGNNDFWISGWNIISIYSVLMIFIAIALYFSAPVIIRILAPTIGYYSFINTVNLFKILTIYLFWGGLFPVFKGIFHAEKKFLILALAPFSLHIFVIIFVLSLSNTIGNKSIAYGLCFGALVQIFILLINMFKRKIKFQLNFQNRLINIFHSSVFIIIFIEIIGQLYTVIDRYFASQLVDGSISALNYANLVTMLPVSIFALSIGAAIFPSLGESVAISDWNNLSVIIKKSIKVILLVGIPVTLFYFFSSQFIIKTIFQRGAFDILSTAKTAQALRYYSIGLLAIMIHAIFTKCYYSIGKANILLIFSVIAILLKIILSHLFFKILQHGGLALATSLTFIINVILLAVYLRWNIKKKTLSRAT
jgi:putative peptidoglycan lipid II flippase